VNGPNHVVVSGLGGAVEEIVRSLEGDGIAAKRLSVSHAFHSPLMTPMLAEFRRVCDAINYSPPQVGLISNVTGELGGDKMATPEYWCDHVLATVRFQDGAATAGAQGATAFLEIGPQPILLNLTRQCVDAPGALWLPSLREGQDDGERVLASLGELYVNGATVDWRALDGDAPRPRIDLPTYPFERTRYWIDPTPAHSAAERSHASMSNREPRAAAASRQTETTATSRSTREATVDNIRRRLRELVARMLMLKPEEVDVHQSLIEIGADSLILADAIRTIDETFGVKLRMRQIFEDLPTLDCIAAHLAQTLGDQVEAEVPAALSEAVQEVDHAPPIAAEADLAPRDLEQTLARILDRHGRVMDGHLRLMSQSLELLKGGADRSRNGLSVNRAHAEPALNGDGERARSSARPTPAIGRRVDPEVRRSADSGASGAASQAFGPYRPRDSRSRRPRICAR
jgi:iturin family lipopeptide synthetase A